MSKQLEIEIPANEKSLWCKHSCKIKEQPMVLMQRSLDPKYFIGTCPACGAQVVARKK